jgi:hypothetical protein
MADTFHLYRKPNNVSNHNAEAAKLATKDDNDPDHRSASQQGRMTHNALMREDIASIRPSDNCRAERDNAPLGKSANPYTKKHNAFVEDRSANNALANKTAVAKLRGANISLVRRSLFFCHKSRHNALVLRRDANTASNHTSAAGLVGWDLLHDALAGEDDALAGEDDALAGEDDALAGEDDALAGEDDALAGASGQGDGARSHRLDVQTDAEEPRSSSGFGSGRANKPESVYNG